MKEDFPELKLPSVWLPHGIFGISNSELKRWLLGTQQSYVNKNKLDYYLDEYVFRYNRRTSTSRELLFLRLIEQGVKTPPISYEKIINQNHG